MNKKVKKTFAIKADGQLSDNFFTSNNMSYALEKLRTVYYELAIGEEDIKGRIAKVQVELLLVPTNQLPDYLKDEWQSILKDLTIKGVFNDFNGKILQGAIPNTLIRMRKKTASQIAKRIINLYIEAENYAKFQKEGAH